jgi:hypothetical protein
MALRITRDMMTLGSTTTSGTPPGSASTPWADGTGVWSVATHSPGCSPAARARLKPVEPDWLMGALSVCRRHGDVRCRLVLACLDARGKGHGAALNRASTRR